MSPPWWSVLELSLLPSLPCRVTSEVENCPGRRSGRPSAPGVTRTRGQQFRKLLLYPSELRGPGSPSPQPVKMACRAVFGQPGDPSVHRRLTRRRPCGSALPRAAPAPSGTRSPAETTTRPPRPPAFGPAARLPSPFPPVASTSSTIRALLPGSQPVPVALERVGPVLQRVLLGHPFPRELPRLPERDEARSKRGRHCPAEDEPSGLDPDDVGHSDARRTVPPSP